MSDLSQFFRRLEAKFDPEQAADLDITYCFMVDDSPFSLVVSEQTCQFREEQPENPDITLRLTEATCRALLNRELSGTQAFLSGRVRLEGPISLAMRLPDLFSRSN